MALPTAISAGDPGHISDHEEIHFVLRNVEEADDYDIARAAADLFASRGAAGTMGSLYFATNIGESGALYFDTGSGWLGLWEMMPEAQLVLLDTSPTVSKLKVPSCRVGKSGGQSISSGAMGTLTALTWNDESGTNKWDNDALHDSGGVNTRLTASRAGYWIVGCQTEWQDDATGDRRTVLIKNGATELAEHRVEAGAVTRYPLTHLVFLAEGDYVEFHVAQNSGSALDVQVGSNAFMAFNGSS